MTRSERQEECIQKWVNAKCRGSLELATGFGKTKTALDAISKFLAKNPGRCILVSVPTDEIKRQWLKGLADRGLFMNVQVEIINSIIKHDWIIDMLVIDECHLSAAETFKQIFVKVKYSIILCLTATMERLDGKHVLIERYAPIIDRISIEEAVENKWLAPVKEYKVLLEVDLTEYKKVNAEFIEHFAFFRNDFNLAMDCVTDWKKRNLYRDFLYVGSDSEEKSRVGKQILTQAMGFSRCLHFRKNFIASHPKKIEVCNLILEHRKDKKAITFSQTIKIAEKIKYGDVLSSKQTKKKRKVTFEEFVEMKVGVLNSSKALNAGVDIPGLELGIIMNTDSSKTTKIQKVGRTCRFSPNKEAELFVLILKGTKEEDWFSNSSTNKNYISIDEEQLLNVLEYKPFTTKKNKETTGLFRF